MEGTYRLGLDFDEAVPEKRGPPFSSPKEEMRRWGRRCNHSKAVGVCCDPQSLRQARHQHHAASENHASFFPWVPFGERERTSRPTSGQAQNPIE
jgi:hypothetical protein